MREFDMVKHMKRDAIYARYSSHAQDDGTSIEVQLEQCERAAGGACVHYIDRAKTGRATGGREALQRMLADAAAGKLARIFVYKFDRLGRSADTHLIAQQLDDVGVELISATEGGDSLARGIHFVFGENYSKVLAQRTKDGLLKRFEQSAWTGGPSPYGYRIVQRGVLRVLEIDPAESAIVREIVHNYVCQGDGFKRIANDLRERGVKTRKGNPFCFTSIRAILVNPILKGSVRYNVRRMMLDRNTNRRLPRFREDTEVRERQDETLRIIDDATFDAIQTKLSAAARGSTVRAAKGIAPFTGLIYCRCGAKCYRAKSENHKGTYYYYRCSRQQRYRDCENVGRVREDKIVRRVERTIGVMLDNTDAIIARVTDLAMREVNANRQDKTRLQQELGIIERKHASLVDQTTEAPSEVRAVLYREIGKLETRRNEIAASLDDLHDDANDVAEAMATIIRQKLDDARAALSTAVSPEDFNRIVQEFAGPRRCCPMVTFAKSNHPQPKLRAVARLHQ